MSYDVLADIRELFKNDYTVHWKTTKESPIRYLWVTIAGREYRIDRNNLMVEARGTKQGYHGHDFFAKCLRLEFISRREKYNATDATPKNIPNT